MKLKINVVNEQEAPCSSSRDLELPHLQQWGTCALCDGPRWPSLRGVSTYDVIFAVVDANAQFSTNRAAFREGCSQLDARTKVVPKGWVIRRGVDAAASMSLWIEFFGALWALGAELRCVGFLSVITEGRSFHHLLALAAPTTSAFGSHLRFSKKLLWYVQWVEGLMAANYYFATLGGASYLIGGKWAPAAMWLAYQQLKVSRILGHRMLESQCCIHLSFNFMVLKDYRSSFRHLWRELEWARDVGKERWVYIVRVAIYNLRQEIRSERAACSGKAIPLVDFPLRWSHRIDREMEALEQCLPSNVTVQDAAAAGTSFSQLMGSA